MKPAVIDGAIAKHFSDIQFQFIYMYILQTNVLYYQLHGAVIFETFANNFSDMGTSHRGGSALLS